MSIINLLICFIFSLYPPRFCSVPSHSPYFASSKLQSLGDSLPALPRHFSVGSAFYLSFHEAPCLCSLSGRGSFDSDLNFYLMFLLICVGAFFLFLLIGMFVIFALLVEAF